MLKIQVIGNLTEDPQLTTRGDTTFCNFSIAENNARTNDVSYIKVTAFNNQAVACNDYLQKGSQISVEGTPKAEAWIDKNTGEAKGVLKVYAKEIEFLSRTKSKEQANSSIDQALESAPAPPTNIFPNKEAGGDR